MFVETGCQYTLSDMKVATKLSAQIRHGALGCRQVVLLPFSDTNALTYSTLQQQLDAVVGRLGEGGAVYASLSVPAVRRHTHSTQPALTGQHANSRLQCQVQGSSAAVVSVGQHVRMLRRLDGPPSRGVLRPATA